MRAGDRSDKRHTLPGVSKLKIGYARVSTDAQGLTAQRDGLQALGVQPDLPADAKRVADRLAAPRNLEVDGD